MELYPLHWWTDLTGDDDTGIITLCWYIIKWPHYDNVIVLYICKYTMLS